MGLINSLFGSNNHFQINKEEALKLIGEDAIVIDIRTERERGAVEPIFEENLHIDFKTFEHKIEELVENNKLNKNDSYIVFCTSGYKGLKAVKILRNFGFEKSFNLKYGTNAWYANDDGCGT